MVTQTVTLPQGRLAYYDRNPVFQDISNESIGLAPHALTNRVTYTVPTGKRAQITDLYLHVLRRTAATTALIARSLWQTNTTNVAMTRIFTNGVGDKESVTIGPARVLPAGQGFLGRDEDLSTAGTVDFEESVGIVEFDV